MRAQLAAFPLFGLSGRAPASPRDVRLHSQQKPICNAIHLCNVLPKRVAKCA